MPQDVNVSRSAEKGRALPEGVRPGEGVVVARQNVNGQFPEGTEEFDDARDQRIVYLIVFEEITRDEERIDFVLASQVESAFEGGEPGFAKLGTPVPELRETRPQLPIG